MLEGAAENDAFNRLIVDVGLSPQAVVLFRARSAICAVPGCLMA